MNHNSKNPPFLSRTTISRMTNDARLTLIAASHNEITMCNRRNVSSATQIYLSHTNVAGPRYCSRRFSHSGKPYERGPPVAPITNGRINNGEKSKMATECINHGAAVRLGGRRGVRLPETGCSVIGLRGSSDTLPAPGEQAICTCIWVFCFMDELSFLFGFVVGWKFVMEI